MRAGEATTAGGEYLYPSGSARAENGQESQGLDLKQISPVGGCKGTAINSNCLLVSLLKENLWCCNSLMLVPGKLSPAARGSLPARAGIAHHAAAVMKWPQLQERLCSPGSPAILCISLVSAGAGQEHYFTIWKAKQICFNWIQCWPQYWFKSEDSLCVSVHWGETYLDEEESFTASQGRTNLDEEESFTVSQGRIILVISDACQNALPGIIDEGDKLIWWLPFKKGNAFI